MIRTWTVLAAVGMTAGVAMGQVDGSISGDGYGAPYALQTVNTEFGDNFSELNGAYARVSGGRFYLALTGNLENNFNKLEIFLQSGPGGNNVFDSAGNDGANAMDGMTFDAGFAPTHHLIARRGNSVFDFDFANLVTQSASGYFNVFGGSDFGMGSTGTGVNGSPVELAYNGSNAAGVGGGTGPANPADALAVTTGIELSIALSDLGLMGIDGESICVMAFVNGSNHNFASNQFLPGLPPPQGNLGGDGNGTFTGTLSGINLNNFGGDQYFCVAIPAPGAAALLGLGGLLAARRRR